MTYVEFIVLVLWVMVPPWLVGAVLLWRCRRAIWPQLAFLLLTMSIAASAFLFAPHWIGRLLGLHHVGVMGREVLLSPLGWVSALLAWPLSVHLFKVRASLR